MATYNTIIMYDFHQKLQKKAPERLKNLERLRILIYSATIPAGAAVLIEMDERVLFNGRGERAQFLPLGNTMRFPIALLPQPTGARHASSRVRARR